MKFNLRNVLTYCLIIFILGYILYKNPSPKFEMMLKIISVYLCIVLIVILILRRKESFKAKKKSITLLIAGIAQIIIGFWLFFRTFYFIGISTTAIGIASLIIYFRSCSSQV